MDDCRLGGEATQGAILHGKNLVRIAESGVL